MAIACGRQPPPHERGEPTPTPGSFTFGTGRDGPLEVAAPTIVNVCHPLLVGSAGTLQSGDGNLGVHAGGLLLVLQTQVLLTTNSGVTPDSTVAGSAGEMEIVRVAVSNSASGGAIVLEDSLKRIYATGAGGTPTAQACTLPEFTDVTIESGGALVPSFFGTGRNGVVAALIAGTLTVASNGQVNADAAGFTGGFVQANDNSNDITLPMTLNGQGGGKGEGLDGRSLQYAGRAPAANGAGGGNAHNSGGGGGGNGGAGGFGGLEASGFVQDPNTRGIGGTAIVSAAPRLILGGGGGAGHQNGGHGGAGGPGGGAILLSAQRLAGAGTIRAEGGVGGDSSNGGDDGAGGGGAGGTVIVYALVSTGWNGTIDVRGGNGGNLVQTAGPGAGGGGGRVYWPSALPTPALVILTGGTPGITGTPADGHHGATTGSSGQLILY